ncbi:unnamed protein product [Victoria cruziana]
MSVSKTGCQNGIFGGETTASKRRPSRQVGGVANSFTRLDSRKVACSRLLSFPLVFGVNVTLHGRGRSQLCCKAGSPQASYVERRGCRRQSELGKRRRSKGRQKPEQAPVSLEILSFSAEKSFMRHLFLPSNGVGKQKHLNSQSVST